MISLQSVSSELVNEFRRSASADIAALKLGLDAAIGDGREAAGAIDRMLVILHIIMGQGASFGYPLITEIARSLHDFLDCVSPPLDQVKMEAVRHHLGALDLVLNRDIRGSGGDSGTRLIATLRQLTGGGQTPH